MTQTAENLAEIARSLTPTLLAALGPECGTLRVDQLTSEAAVVDSTMKASVRDERGRPLVFILCSPSASPHLVARSTHRARQAKAVLGPPLGDLILEPLVEGEVHGLSYAVFPHCDSLSTFLPMRLLQRRFITRFMVEWLFQVNERTVRETETAALAFSRPLERVAEMAQLSNRVRTAAAEAKRRLDSRVWKPRHVLMHGDLWLGNVLLRHPTPGAPRWHWADRAVVIDWPGSQTLGYAIYDLVRLSESANLNRTNLFKELKRHCELLDCELFDATSYITAALGDIAINLEHFPLERYARMAEQCVATVQDLVP